MSADLDHFAPPRATLADRVVVRPRIVADVGVVTAGAALVAVLAQVQVPLWPVPVTGQTLGVLLVGAALGARRGALSLSLYLAAGLSGAPIFAGFSGGPLTVLSPSFGYIVGFVFAAALIGGLAERRWDRRPVRALIGLLAASVVPFLFGVPYMVLVLTSSGRSVDVQTALALGVMPFVVGGMVKWLIAAAVLPVTWRVVEALDSSTGRRS